MEKQDNICLPNTENSTLEDIKSKLPTDVNVVIFANEYADSYVSAALLIKAFPKESLHAIVLNHGLTVCRKEAEICRDLQKLGFTNIHVFDAKKKIFDSSETAKQSASGSLNSLTSPLSVRYFINKILIDVYESAAASLGLDESKTYIADCSAKDEEIIPYNEKLSNLKNSNLPNEPFIAARARKGGRLIETNKCWLSAEIPHVAKMLGFNGCFTPRSNSIFSNITELMHTTRPTKFVLTSNKEDLRELVSDYKLDAAVAPIKSVEYTNDGKRRFKHPALIASDKYSARELMQIYRMIPSSVRGINRVLVRVDENSLPDRIYNHGLRVRRKTVEITKVANKIALEAVKETGISTCGVVLAPIAVSKEKPGSCIIRFTSCNNGLAERTSVPGVDFDEKLLKHISKSIKEACPQIGMVFYEATAYQPKTVNAL